MRRSCGACRAPCRTKLWTFMRERTGGVPVCHQRGYRGRLGVSQSVLDAYKAAAMLSRFVERRAEDI